MMLYCDAFSTRQQLSCYAQNMASRINCRCIHRAPQLRSAPLWVVPIESDTMERSLNHVHPKAPQTIGNDQHTKNTVHPHTWDWFLNISKYICFVNHLLLVGTFTIVYLSCRCNLFNHQKQSPPQSTSWDRNASGCSQRGCNTQPKLEPACKTNLHTFHGLLWISCKSVKIVNTIQSIILVSF